MMRNEQDVQASGTQDRTSGVEAAAQYVCAECRYADLYALEPRLICTHPLSRHRGRELFAGQPACDDVSPGNGVNLVLAAYRWRARS